MTAIVTTQGGKKLLISVAVLALLGGVGAVFAPVPTFLIVAAGFLWGLRASVGGYRPAIPTSEDGTISAKAAPAGGLARRLVPIFLFFWWVVLVAPLAAYSPREVGSGAVESTATGSLQNQVLVASFGIVGMLFLPAAIRKIRGSFWWLLALWALYMVWGYTSLFWSAYPMGTLRNLAAYVLVTMGCFGLGAGFYGARPDGARVFLRHLTVAGVISALVILIPLPRYLAVFNPFDPAQRLEISGGLATFSARPVMVVALALIVASMVGLRRWGTRDWFLLVILLTPILLLKTRGPMLFALLAFAAVYLLCRSRFHDRVFQIGLALVAGLGYLVLRFSGALGTISTYMTRGDAELSMTLTGRMPLWDVLIPLAEQRPFLGAGFSAFWNPDNLYLVKRLVGFPVVSAHNGFLEEILNTGLIGLAIFLSFWIFAMILSVRMARRGERVGWLAFLFLVFYLLLNLTSSIMQDYLEVPFMVVFVALGLLAVRPQKPPVSGGSGSMAPLTLSNRRSG